MRTFKASMDLRAAGMDQRPTGGLPTLIDGFTRDKATGGLDTRAGWERFYPEETGSFTPFTSDDVAALYTWEIHGGALPYVLFQQGTSLYYLGNNPASKTLLTDTLAAPDPTQPGVQFIPYGDWLIILDGHIAPLAWRGGAHLRPLGWRATPQAPAPWGVDLAALVPGVRTTGLWGGDAETGLGSATANDNNSFKYRVSWVDELGGESPLSASSLAVEWQTPASGVGVAHGDSTAIVLLDGISPGPEGTVARRIYRTKNLGQGLPEEFYYVGTLYGNEAETYFDGRADNELGSLAPDGSVVLPAPHAHAGASWGGRLWIAGRSEPRRVYYSDPGNFDFDGLNFVDLPAELGEVRYLHAHYGMLLALQDNGVSLIGNVGSNTIDAAPILVGRGTPLAVVSTPWAGAVVLTDQGVYAIQGGTVGGAVAKVQDLGAPIQRMLEEMELPAKVHAVYDPAEDRALFSIPRKGSRTLLALYRQGWQVYRDWPFGPLAFYHGAVIAGRLGSADSYGVFALTRAHKAGCVLSGQALVDNPAPVATFRSPWHRAPSYISPRRVVLDVITGAGAGGSVTVKALFDGDYWTDQGGSPGHEVANPDEADPPVYGHATWETDTWQEGRVTRIAFSVPPRRSQYVAFEFSTSTPFTFLGYSLEYLAGGVDDAEGSPR